jgi:glutamate synthase domain-containing protein 2
VKLSVLALAAALSLPLAARAAELVQLSGPARSAAPAVPMALYGSLPGAWASAVGQDMSRLTARFGAAGSAPVLRSLGSLCGTPEAFAALPPRERAERLFKAELAARDQAHAEAAALLAQLPKADPAKPDYALLVARLQQLQGPLSGLLDGPEASRVRAAYAQAHGRLSEDQRRRFAALLERAFRTFKGGAPVEGTLVELAAADLPQTPAGLMTPRVAELRRAQAPAPAWDHRLAPPLPPAPRPLPLRARVAAVTARQALIRAAAQGVYVPARDAFRWAMGHAGEIWRKYVSGREVDKHNFRWGVIEKLHKEGDFRGSLGHPVYDYMPEVMSPLIFRDDAVAEIRKQTRLVGRDLVVDGERYPVKPVELSPMMGVSGMSFPQLSAQSHLSLIYIHLKLAQSLGVRVLDNTGEGGPGLHLAILEGDREKARRYLVDWNLANKQFQQNSWGEAEITRFVDQLMDKRDALFKDFTPEDLARSQVVAQFGSALNGIRGEGGFVDFDKLRNIGGSPFVAMTQFKLKQAAKRGARVDSRKIDSVVAALREIPRGSTAKSPEVNPDFSSYEDIAALVRATKLVTRKPVSLKFGVGSVTDLRDFLSYLKEHDALPDHIQLDGRGEDFSPGSGNAPPGANTSLPSNEAVIVTDAVLKQLGVRDQVFLEATGDIFLPADGVEKLALGADGLSGARVWMNMGLGCAKVKACANGNCPYGIASRSNSLVGLSLDPAKIAPKGFTAGANWFRAYTQTLAETGTSDWRTLRSQIGLASRSTAVRLKVGPKMLPLDRVYDLDYVSDLLRGVMTRREVKRLVFGRY